MVIKNNTNRATIAPIDLLLSKARDAALQAPRSAFSDTILELCAAIDSLQAEQAEIRREAFRDAVRGIANAILKGQVPATVPWAENIPGAYGSREQLATEIERANATEPVTIAELRQLRQKLKTDPEGSDEIDDAIKRLYYAKLFEKEPDTENILPPGSPSRSMDMAALITQRVLPNGWWTLGSNGVNIADPSVAKVGTWAGDNPKAESAATPALTLLSALILTLIEAAKKDV